ncbi:MULTISPECIES: helix-turn-helix domain-containing protein [Bacillus]|uniref:helix-turn-helix domain-containing protein n=1 Tax=Bacillus TaxID=1386 RepID=UPI00028A0BB2|nr:MULTISPECIES: helix-turn-helix domain-containing protein [Bacillus]MBV7321682.1 helix-turn-helix domain-containing protein [Halalkalibacterium halodurans]MBG9768879.1 DNA-binding protein [Bacillus vallismortis]MCV0026893.1 helix-turn-helix domain-containing protein [Bacillus sp. XT-2]QAV10311.1 DNA-binding protein [Bacillus vallismortis]QNS20482.1 helix-turn-helix domain-containing protein [Bacillus halotolerans]
MKRTALTPQEAADFLGVHKETIYIMVRNGQIPHFKVRKKIFFRVDSLNEWIKQQEQNSMKELA